MSLLVLPDHFRQITIANITNSDDFHHGYIRTGICMMPFRALQSARTSNSNRFVANEGIVVFVDRHLILTESRLRSGYRWDNLI